MAARLIATMALARYLGTALFGDYSYIAALVGTFELLSDLGLNQIAIREIAKRRDKADEYFGDVLMLKGLMTLISLAILVVAANVTPGDPRVRVGVYLYGISAILNYLVNTYFVLYRAYEKMQYEALLIVAERGTYVLLIILLISRQASFLTLFWANIISVVFKLVLGAWLTASRFTLPRIRLDWGRYKKYLRDTLPVGVGLIVDSISFRIDIVLLGILATSEIVGFFSGAYRIIEATKLMWVVWITALFPVMARRAAISLDAVAALLQRTIKILLLVVTPSAIALVVLAHPVTLFVLGKEFAESTAVLRVLALTIVPIGLNSLFSFTFISINRQDEYAKITSGALVLNIIIDITLIPIVGYWGACMGTIAAETIRFCLCYWRMRSKIGPLHFWKTTRRLVLPNLALAAVMVAVMSWSWIAAALAGGIVYLVVLRLVGALDQDERRVMRRALGRAGHLLG
jgi:O-antigen/teichoic acid export membrane protein